MSSLADISNEELIKIMREIETKYPFVSQLILQLSNQTITDGGLTSKAGPDKINNIEIGENNMTTDLKALKEKISSLKAQGDGVVAVGETAEKPEQSKDLDYTEFINTLVDAIGDLKKDAGTEWKVWAADKRAIEAKLESLQAQLEAVKAQTPKQLGEQSDVEEAAPPGKVDSKMIEKRASKKAMEMEDEEEEKEDKKASKKAKIEDPGAPTSVHKYEEDDEEKEEKPAEVDKEEEEEEEDKMEASKKKTTGKQASGKGVTNTDSGVPNFPKEYAWMGDILKAGKKSWGSLQ